MTDPLFGLELPTILLSKNLTDKSYIWLDRPVAVTTLARLSKGKMMGVDFNKNKEWVGSSCCLFEEV